MCHGGAHTDWRLVPLKVPTASNWSDALCKALRLFDLFRNLLRARGEPCLLCSEPAGREDTFSDSGSS